MTGSDEGTGDAGAGGPAADGYASPPGVVGPDPADPEVPDPVRSASRRRLIDIGVVTAVIALLFSASTYWIDRRGQDRADQRQARSELTEVVGKMAALPREYATLTVPSNGVDPATLGANFTSELIVLVAQAERLVDDNPSIVGPADRLSIGTAHLNLGNYEEAVAAFAAAKRQAAAESDERLVMASLTDAAVAEFGLGRAGRGRTGFRRAIRRAGTDARSGAQIRTDVDFILRRWAQTELVIGNCQGAAELIAEITIPTNRSAAQADHDAACAPTG